MPGHSRKNIFANFVKIHAQTLRASIAVLVAFGIGLTATKAQILDPQEKALSTALMNATIEKIKADKELFQFARHKGAMAFARNCTRCHGSEGRGTPGVPALNDKDWLWGGDFESIYWTIRYGVRGENDLARQSSMPDFSANKILSEEEATQMAQFVLTLSDNPDFESPVGEQFSFLCSTCHGPYGEGYKGFGAPSLSDNTWLYGGTIDDIKSQILAARHGVMPSWENQLPPETVKALAVYVHSLGGGE